MDIDYGVIIGLIGAVCVAGMLGLSYVGAFMLGQARGRREGEREAREARAEEREESRVGHAERLLVVEGAVDAVARAMERLSDAQRLQLLESHRSVPDARPAIVRDRPHNTPA